MSEEMPTTVGQPDSRVDAGGDAIAVVGLAGRFPGAETLDRLWANLVQGVESITTLSPEALAAAGVRDELASDPAYVPAGGFLDRPERFDAELFGFGPREAALLDPQHRLFFESAWHALEDAGLDPFRTPERTAVLAGSGLSRYLIDHVYPALDLDDPAAAYQAALANDKDFLATRVAYALGLEGTALSVQTACSTSLVAVALACQSLATGDCDLALAGGVTLRLPLGTGYLYQEDGILSPDGHCRAFDADARGTVPGSGVGAVVLARLEDAIAAGYPVRAVIRGWATNNDGSEKAGYTAPRAEGQARVVAEALALAGVEPETVGYVEAHGTATRLGDPIEVAALTRAFGPDVAPGSVGLGSIKTNLGHLDAAAGVAGLIKAVLALERREIPPSLHFRHPNPEIDLAGSPFRVVTERTPWAPGRAPRRAGVSSFGIGGTNAHAVLEEAPVLDRSGRSGPGPRLFVVSAASSEGLDRVAEGVAGVLADREDLNAADVAHTLLAGRAALRHRRAVVGRGVAGAPSLVTGKEALEGVAPPGAAPVAFLLPGQGSQHAGMAAELYERQPLFRRELDRCADILAAEGGPAFGGRSGAVHDVLTGGAGTDRNGPLVDTTLAQPLLFAVEYALAALWQGWGVVPEALLGHSVGELVAACLAGVLELEDALPLVAARGRLVGELPGGAMLAVPLGEKALLELLDDRRALTLAAVNAPTQCTVSGPEEVVDAFRRELAADGVEGRPLRTSHAFHSPLVEPAVEPFRELVARCRLRPPRIPFLSNVTGTWITEEQAIDPAYWARHLRAPVRFAPAAAELLAEPRRLLLEVGPGDALTRLVTRHPEGRMRVVVPSLPHAAERAGELESVLTAAARLWIGGAPAGPRFADLDLDPDGDPSGARRRVRLPGYPFGGARHWIEATPADRRRKGHEESRAGGAGGGIDKEPDLADWFYVPTWRRSLPSAALAPPPRPDGADGSPERWLLLEPPGAPAEGPLGAALASELEARGIELLDVDRQPPASAEEGDPEGVLEELLESGTVPDRIVFLAGADGDATGAGAADPSEDLGLLLAWVQTLARRVHGRSVTLAVVTERLYDVAGEGSRAPERAALAGFARVVPQEHPAIQCRLVDLAPDGRTPAGPAEGAGRDLAVRLVDELIRGGDAPVVALRGAHRFEPAHEAIRVEGPAGLPADPAGHHLLTGGLGRFALAVAERLVEERRGVGDEGPLRITLVDRPDAVEDIGGELAARLEALRDAGAEVAVAGADVTDDEALTRAVAEAVERFGPLAGVVHAAGAPSGSYRTLGELTLADCLDHLAPKLRGTRNLASALARLESGGVRPGARVLCASSLAPVLGGVGLAPFAVGDAALDALAEALDREAARGVRWQSVDWEGWEDLGADGASGGLGGTELGRQQTALMMTPEEVGEAFVRALSVHGIPRLVVATGDLPARIVQWGDVLRRRGDACRRTGPVEERPPGAPPYHPPEGPVETRVAEVWSELLGVAEVGADDDFFLFGGDSLIGLQVLSKLRAEFDVELPLRSFFEARTLSGVARVIDEERRRGEAEARRTEELLEEIEGLSEDEVTALLAQEEGE